jgi:hypothetical protein
MRMVIRDGSLPLATCSHEQQKPHDAQGENAAATSSQVMTTSSRRMAPIPPRHEQTSH